MSTTWFYVRECCLVDECTSQSWRRIRFNCHTEAEAREVLLRHLQNSSHHRDMHTDDELVELARDAIVEQYSEPAKEDYSYDYEYLR